MKRHRRSIALGTATATAGLIIASVPGQIEAVPSWIQPAISGAALIHNGGKEQHTGDNRPVIDVHNLAEKPLTPALKDAIGATALIDTRREFASGVRISPNRYLTSGHMFIDNDNRAIPGCDSTQATTANGKSATTRAVTKAAIVRHNPPDADLTKNQRDVAVLQTSKATDGPIATLAPKNQDLAPGTPVVLSNYEPTGSDSYRDPRHSGRLHDPAVFNAVVLEDDRGDNGQLAIMTGVGVSYNRPSERLTRPGASGGEIDTYDGVTRAITTATDADAQGRAAYGTIADIEQRFNVNIVGETSDHAQITYAQPVNTQLLRSLGSLSDIASLPCA